jgi:hypothetical protein
MRAERGIGRWVKGRVRRGGAWLSIAALLLQLLVTAGHFHAEDFGFLAGPSAETAFVGSSGGPSGEQPGALAHDDCALCFSLQLASSAALPDIAPLAAPPEVFAELRLPPEQPRRVARPYLLFRTRAPPIL